MLRTICVTNWRLCDRQLSLESVRTKAVQATVSQADRLKLWNKENKELFGPLLESKKQKSHRQRKAFKSTTQSGVSNQDSSVVNKESEIPVKKNVLKIATNSLTNSIVTMKTAVLNMKPQLHVLSLVMNKSLVRGVTTFAPAQSVHYTPVQPGYPSEDKILQIRPHQNDYAEQYPSVTLILNKTMSDEAKAALEKWKVEKISELGPEGFQKFHEGQLALGSKFHNTLKNYFTQPQTQLRIEKDVEGIWNSVQNVLVNVSSPKAIESNVVHPVLKYRGIFDAIADYDDKPTLIEWKKSDRPRKALSLTYDNPIQLAAYFGAVCNDLNYKHLNVRDALLVIAYPDGSKADAYHFSMEKLREHWAHWLIRLEQYTAKFGKDAEKKLKGGKMLFEDNMGNLG